MHLCYCLSIHLRGCFNCLACKVVFDKSTCACAQHTCDCSCRLDGIYSCLRIFGRFGCLSCCLRAFGCLSCIGCCLRSSDSFCTCCDTCSSSTENFSSCKSSCSRSSCSPCCIQRLSCVEAFLGHAGAVSDKLLSALHDIKKSFSVGSTIIAFALLQPVYSSVILIVLVGIGHILTDSLSIVLQILPPACRLGERPVKSSSFVEVLSYLRLHCGILDCATACEAVC